MFYLWTLSTVNHMTAIRANQLCHPVARDGLPAGLVDSFCVSYNMYFKSLIFYTR